MGMLGNLVRVSSADLESFIAESSSMQDRIYDEEFEDRFVDIDKAWDGILYLLTGERYFESENPLIQVLFSGQLIDEEQDVGYGPAHYLTADQVKDLNDQLLTVTSDDLKKRYDAETMMRLEVYPEIWQDEDSLDYLLSNFEIIKNTYAQAAKNGEAMITFLS